MKLLELVHKDPVAHHNVQDTAYKTHFTLVLLNVTVRKERCLIGVVNEF